MPAHTLPSGGDSSRVKEEKDQLKLHKSAFKSLVKQNGIRLGSDVSQENFNDVFNVH